jgi:preprotein translocase subunit SecG
MLILLTTVYVIICLFLIIVVLLQSGKAADLAGAFGGMGSQSAFGPRGTASMLSRATAVAAALFMILSIWIGVQQGAQRGPGASVIERSGLAGEAVPTPAAPATIPAVPTDGLPAGVDIDITPVEPGAVVEQTQE